MRMKRYPLRKTCRDISLGLAFASGAVFMAGLWIHDATAQMSNILWSADHEEGDLSEWYLNGGGAEANSGDAVSVASTDVAHSGRYSAKATITAPPVAGVRLFRWREGPANPIAYYSALFYFPRIYTPNTGHWNIFQFKSRDCESGCSSAGTDPFWYLNVGKRPDGTMYLTLRWWGDLWTLRGVEGPHQGEFGWYTYEQTLKDLPVGQWVHIEAFLRQSSGFTGQIIIWQDGVEIFNQNNVKTRYPYEGNWWSINNYSGSISPSPATIYFDDAVISTTRVGFLAVDIDIKPGTFPNSINLGSGTVPVAILSNAFFDANRVDPMSVALASAEVRLKGNGTPMAALEDANGDGLLDLVVHVSTEALELSESDTDAILEGHTFDGTSIRGKDSVQIVP